MSPLHASRPVKKGIGSCGKTISATDLSRLHLRWYYNWTPFPKKTSVLDLEFVPMFWWGADVNPKNLASVYNSGANNILGFNEPDLGGQSNMTVNDCADLWPTLMELPQRLGSPAPASPPWLEKFMEEATRRGLRVDFVCLHSYPDFTDPNAIENLEAMLRGVHEKYRLPIWLTECGTADVKKWYLPQVSQPTPEKAQLFLKRYLNLMARLPFVERYAWFADQVDKEYAFGSLFGMESNTLTPMGAIYRDAP